MDTNVLLAVYSRPPFERPLCLNTVVTARGSPITSSTLNISFKQLLLPYLPLPKWLPSRNRRDNNDVTVPCPENDSQVPTLRHVPDSANVL
ncbi:hypothetical protein CDAR_54141 [Caerostris darwini]|uniref:PIN domain-containing protein n=1 Tax=Caerostris darwini TaxID=1538125 RepID=A0AAV4N1H3_9ARAC|nr:hypothetical protein CDAR_54141 [Caerostris darwini]